MRQLIDLKSIGPVEYGDESVATVQKEPYRRAVYLPPFFHSERSLATALRNLLTASPAPCSNWSR